MHKSLELIIILLIAFIPFLKTSLTYDPTFIKTTLIKAGILLMLGIYLINALRNKKIEIKRIVPISFLALLSWYLIINFILKYPVASSEDLFLALLFFGFFLSSATSLLPLSL